MALTPRMNNGQDPVPTSKRGSARSIHAAEPNYNNPTFNMNISDSAQAQDLMLQKMNFTGPPTF